jgi:Cu/Ag efflux pump CusA
MMRWIVEWSMQLRLLMVAAAAALIFFGVTELRHMPLDTVPEFSRPYVEIQTEALGLSAEEVEAMITVPLEADMLNGVSWVEEIRSESIPGLSSIVLFFEADTDLLDARQLVQERLIEVFALPAVSKPPVMLQPVSSTSRFMKVGMTSDTRSLIELSVLARWTVVPRLMGVTGVANVSIWGQRRRQLQVLVEPARLREARVTLKQIIHSAGNALWASPLSFLDAANPGTGGWIETPNQRLGIQHKLPISTSEDLARVTVQGTNRSLGDLTRVAENHQPLIGDAIVDDAPALMLVVEKFPWANTVEVTQATEEALGALQLGLPGLEMDSSLFRPATYLELVTGNLASALAIAAVLVVVALVGLLSSWRTALISSIAVLVSGLVALTFLYLREVPVNLMIIAGIMVALAALIDDSIIDVQNIARRLRGQGKEGGETSTAKLVFEASLGMRGPIVYATLIGLLLVAPAYFMEGLAGSFGQPIALAYGLALLASMLVALMLTPALSLLLLRDAPSQASESPLFERLRGGFDRLLSRTTQASGTAFAAGVGAVGFAVLVGLMALAPSVDSLIPQFRERDILINLDAAPGTSEEAMRRIMTRASRELRSIPGVRTVSAHLGRAVMSDRVSDVNTGELWVSVDRTADYDATVASIRATASAYPGFDIDVETYLNERIGDVADHDEELVVRVYGENMSALRGKAEEVQQLLTRVEGVVEPEVEYPALHPSLQVEVNLANAQRYGLKPGDVRRAATTLLSGIEVGSLFEEQKVFDVVVWGAPGVRKSLSDVEELLIDAPNGTHVRLKDVTDMSIRPAPDAIRRDAVARYIDVSAGVEGRSLAAVSAEIEDRVRKEIEFPLEYRVELPGNLAERLASERRVAAFAIAAAIGILLLMQAAFGSWRLGIGFFFTQPVALLGGILAAFLSGGLASLGALLGLLGVYTIAVRNGFSLVQHYRDLERSERQSVCPELVQRGTRERMVPILMSAVVVALAFLPFAIYGNIAGHEILHPMAIVVLGGLASSTLVNLFVVPSLYLALGSGTESLELGLEGEAA